MGVGDKRNMKNIYLLHRQDRHWNSLPGRKETVSVVSKGNWIGT